MAVRERGETPDTESSGWPPGSALDAALRLDWEAQQLASGVFLSLPGSEEGKLAEAPAFSMGQSVCGNM